MSEALTAAARAQGPPRSPGQRAVRPKNAATMILVRRDGPKPRVLMGRRNDRHTFMPGMWVFPGGRVDRSDRHAPAASDLKPEIAALFDNHHRPGRALAMAAVRETFEEAGLLLARPAPSRPAAGPWREFLAQGALPDLSPLDIVARAITPPSVAKRFDTWFLMAEADRLISLERQPDCGELDEIAWVDFDEAIELKLPNVTRFVLGEARARLDAPHRPRIFLKKGVSHPTRAVL
ncbi:MAG TPA: NUDIX hydrolase [Phenylobacterium sp.]|uniref:NUDIX hydrolase n=1 Tax=Phenylobacterium sp. TaxID=1871053 RepID=UPI002B468319|nr:NUDIX hydrolase [Phenylobacterium sp.]HKR89061.1 NUDIX hydrolase [Phenylobacterium sp.]